MGRTRNLGVGPWPCTSGHDGNTGCLAAAFPRPASTGRAARSGGSLDRRYRASPRLDPRNAEYAPFRLDGNYHLQSLDQRNTKNGRAVMRAAIAVPTDDLLPRFASIVGERYAITDPAMQEPYLKEMRDL